MKYIQKSPKDSYPWLKNSAKFIFAVAIKVLTSEAIRTQLKQWIPEELHQLLDIGLDMMEGD